MTINDENNGERMRIIHDPSDSAILRGADYFLDWRKTRNALLLFDALQMLNVAEHEWNLARGPRVPMRREWQVLRRCVMRALGGLRKRLLDARSPEQTERAIYAGGKRATLARTDQLNDRAVTTALGGATIDQAAKILEGWGKPRSRQYLKKRASQLGLTARKPRDKPAPNTKDKLRGRAAQAPRTVSVAPGRRRHYGNAY